MAFIVTPKRQGRWFKTWDITAQFDSDSVATIVHGFVDEQGNGITPEVWDTMISLRPAPGTYWAMFADNTNIFPAKTINTGSGDSTSPQVRIYAWLPHSLVDNGLPSGFP